MNQGNPLAVVAELTHRCPLHCTYCSNPLELQGSHSELSTQVWFRVFQEAAKLGIFQIHFSGGEPLLRRDLVELVTAAKQSDHYVNLITSGVGLSDSKLDELVQAGTDHIQLSFQAHKAELAEQICGSRAHELKVKAAYRIRKKPVAFTINVVVHRHNISFLKEILEFIEGFSPDRIEIAHAQYYGWAFLNRNSLVPSLDQINHSIAIVKAAQLRLQGRIRIDFVIPDYFAKYPKACMGGWGKKYIVVDPAGRALPCHSATSLPMITFDNVKDHSLSWIWNHSQSFMKFRDEGWMKDPCRNCDRRKQDFGGCRCQAFQITGDVEAADPICTYSPHHEKVMGIR